MIERKFREENIIFIKIQNDCYPRDECQQFIILLLTTTAFVIVLFYKRDAISLSFGPSLFK